MNTEITIPAAYYDSLVDRDLRVPQEQEIRFIGKGKQYVIDRNDPLLPHFVVVATEDLELGDLAAKAALVSLKKQGYPVNVDLPVTEAKPVTRKTNAIGDRRNLIVTITPEGDLILRPAGRRRRVKISLSTVYTLAVNAEAREAIRVAKAKRKERKAQRRAERDAAVLAFKANPTSITL